MSTSKILLAFTVLASSISSAQASPQLAQLVSEPPDSNFFDGFGNGFSSGCTFSEDGQRIAYSSSAFNLVEGDSNTLSDVFVQNRNDRSTELVSRTLTGDLADGRSDTAFISGNGRYVLFQSLADNLGVTGFWQVFRRDLDTGINTAVGFAPDGTEFDRPSPLSLSSDGALATFEADDQVWLRDLDQASTSLISIGFDDQPADAPASEAYISADGSTVVFESAASNLVNDDTNGKDDIFIRDLAQGTTVRLQGQGGVEADGDSRSPRISADGRWIVFFSTATNLTPGDNNGTFDVFLHDRNSNTTIRLSEDSNGTGGNGGSNGQTISADGRFVVFESLADNLVPGLVGQERRLFLYDHDFGTLVQMAASAEEPQQACVFNSGSVGGVAFRTQVHALIPANLAQSQIVLEAFESFDPDPSAASGGRGVAESWVVSRSDPPVPVTVGSGISLDPSLAGQGRFLAFETRAGNLTGRSPDGTQIVRLDQLTGEVLPVSVSTTGELVDSFSGAFDPSIDNAGNRVVFSSRWGGLVNNDSNDTDDIFIRDISLAQTARLSIGLDDEEANGRSTDPVISANGGTVAFESSASNLVENDTNGQQDIFVAELPSRLIRRISISGNGQEAAARSESPAISGNGRFVVFATSADLSSDGAPLNYQQIWLRDRQSDTIALISRGPGGEPGNGDSTDPEISANGRWVAFRSYAANLDPAFPSPPAPSVYLHDRQTGDSRLISQDSSEQAIRAGEAVLAADASAILFMEQIDEDRAGTLRPARGTDPLPEIYLYSRSDEEVIRIDPLTTDGLRPDGEWLLAAVEPGGRVIYLVSEARNLTPGMLTNFNDIYRIDLDFDRLFEDRFQGSAR
ncbi:MAG: hypothetical protein V2J20_04970 [Wenzhouxiangella sp.]|jgi:Tol biopolymer transport system component|nr:hypothetical protein [Wenzhouxiangella sp.]